MKFTIIYSPTIDYAFMQQRPQRIMEQFARHGHQVYYMNQTQQPGMQPQVIEENLTVVHDHAHILNKLPRDHAVVLWISWAQTQGWIDIIKPDIVVYDCLDDFEQWRTYEEVLVPKVDLVTTTAELLYDKMSRKHSNVVMVKNGCEYEHFVNPDSFQTPADWPFRDPQKVVGYVGALGHWVDHELILKIAKEWQLVLIGPEFGMPHLPHNNIHRMGLRNYSSLPGYMKNMGALIIPFQLNDITRATNPIKMYEYLATGKPVVTTAMPEAKLHPEVFACDSHLEFMSTLHDCMIGKHNTAKEISARRKTAAENSWEARYETIIEALDNTAKTKFIK